MAREESHVFQYHLGDDRVDIRLVDCGPGSGGFRGQSLDEGLVRDESEGKRGERGVSFGGGAGGRGRVRECGGIGGVGAKDGGGYAPDVVSSLRLAQSRRDAGGDL